MGDAVKLKVLTKWMNSVLSSGGSVLQVKDILKDLEDGVILCTVVEILSQMKVGRFHKTAKERFQKNYNCKMAVNFIVQQGVKLEALDAFDIVDKNQTAITRFVWAIIKRYQLQASEDDIIQWASALLPSKHKDPVDSWNNGEYLVALLDAFIFPFESTYQDGDVDSALNFVSQQLGAPKLLESNDFPDIQSITLYLSYIRNYILKNHVAAKERESDCFSELVNVEDSILEPASDPDNDLPVSLEIAHGSEENASATTHVEPTHCVALEPNPTENLEPNTTTISTGSLLESIELPNTTYDTTHHEAKSSESTPILPTNDSPPTNKELEMSHETLQDSSQSVHEHPRAPSPAQSSTPSLVQASSSPSVEPSVTLEPLLILPVQEQVSPTLPEIALPQVQETVVPSNKNEEVSTLTEAPTNLPSGNKDVKVLSQTTSEIAPPVRPSIDHHRSRSDSNAKLAHSELTSSDHQRSRSDSNAKLAPQQSLPKSELTSPRPSIDHHRSRSDSNAKLATQPKSPSFSSDQIRPSNVSNDNRSTFTKPSNQVTSSRTRATELRVPIKQDIKTDQPEVVNQNAKSNAQVTSTSVSFPQATTPEPNKNSNSVAQSTTPANNSEPICDNKSAPVVESKSSNNNTRQRSSTETKLSKSTSTKSSFLSWIRPKSASPAPLGPKKTLVNKDTKSTDRVSSPDPSSSPTTPKEDFSKFPPLPNPGSPSLMSRRQSVAEPYDPNWSPGLLRYWELPNSKVTLSPTSQLRSTSTSSHQGQYATDELIETEQASREVTRPVTSYARPWEPARHNAFINSKSRSFVDPSSSESQALQSSAKPEMEISKQRTKSSRITSRVARSLTITVMQDLNKQKVNPTSF